MDLDALYVPLPLERSRHRPAILIERTAALEMVMADVVALLRPSSVVALISSLSNCQSAKHNQRQALPGWFCRPNCRRQSEIPPSLANRIEHAEQIPSRPRQPIEPRDNARNPGEAIARARAICVPAYFRSEFECLQKSRFTEKNPCFFFAPPAPDVSRQLFRCGSSPDTPSSLRRARSGPRRQG